MLTNHNQEYVYRNIGKDAFERYEPKYVNYTQLSGRITGGFWGYITRNGPGHLQTINGKFDSHQYKRILSHKAFPKIKAEYESLGNFIYMHDNSGVHRAAIVKNYIQKQGFEDILKWPAYSPDINPIENLWAYVARDWPSFPNRSFDALEERVHTRWQDLHRNTSK